MRPAGRSAFNKPQRWCRKYLIWNFLQVRHQRGAKPKRTYGETTSRYWKLFTSRCRAMAVKKPFAMLCVLGDLGG